MVDIIHEDQTGFMLGRYMGDNLVALTSIVNHSNKTNQSAILLSFDFEKAFDTVEWLAIINFLRYFNFGEKIITIIKALYTDTTSIVQNNGCTSEAFPIERGLRQGDALSCYLFTLVIEVLGIMLCNLDLSIRWTFITSGSFWANMLMIYGLLIEMIS